MYKGSPHCKINSPETSRRCVLCRVKFHFVLSQIQTSSKVPGLSKAQEQLVRNTDFGRVLLGAFLLRKYPSLLQSFRAHAKPANQNLQGPGLDIEIASCAKNRFQIIIWRGHVLLAHFLSRSHNPSYHLFACLIEQLLKGLSLSSWISSSLISGNLSAILCENQNTAASVAMEMKYLHIGCIQIRLKYHSF